MIYRIHINGGPKPATTASGSDLAATDGRHGQGEQSVARASVPADRWFVTQIESRFGAVIDQPLPRDWTNLVTAGPNHRKS